MLLAFLLNINVWKFFTSFETSIFKKFNFLTKKIKSYKQVYTLKNFTPTFVHIIFPATVGNHFLSRSCVSSLSFLRQVKANKNRFLSLSYTKGNNMECPVFWFFYLMIILSMLINGETLSIFLIATSYFIVWISDSFL